MILVFDTETCGLPADYKAPVTNHANWPRLVSLSWELWINNGQTSGRYHLIIKPEDFEIPEASTKVHGITTQHAILNGVPLKDALSAFERAMEASDLLIAHNIAFDEKIVGAELSRLGMKSRLDTIPKYCTMTAGINVCRIPGYRRGIFKWPTLDQLHRHLFREGFSNAHNSAADTAACSRCYFELKRLAAK